MAIILWIPKTRLLGLGKLNAHGSGPEAPRLTTENFMKTAWIIAFSLGLLAYFDRIGVTRRIGDVRKVRRP